MYQHEFTGRCPSKAQIKKHIVAGLKQDDWVQVSWGENQITVERMDAKNLAGYHSMRRIYGSGWIRRNGGDDLAREIEKELV